jgi:hypothetical protein
MAMMGGTIACGAMRLAEVTTQVSRLRPRIGGAADPKRVERGLLLVAAWMVIRGRWKDAG